MKPERIRLVSLLVGFAAIRAKSGRKDKETFLLQLKRHYDGLLRQVLDYTYNPFKNYRLTIDATKFALDYYSDAEPVDVVWPRFIAILDAMNAGTLSGHAARDKFEETVSPLGDTIQHWLACILNRDLRMGVNVKTIAKLYPDLFPETTPMLCETLDFKDVDAGKRLMFWTMEPKFNGVRGLAFVDYDAQTVKFVTRNGKEVFNTEIVAAELLKLHHSGMFVFDGELLADNWNDTISILHRRTEHPKRASLRFYAFDVVAGGNWYARQTPPLRDRRATLADLITRNGNVVRAKWTPLMTKDALRDGLNAYVKAGYEGAVIKDPNAPYEWGRSDRWLKIKPFYEHTFKIIGFEEGEGRNKGRLGAVRVAGPLRFEKKNFKIDTQVGSGIPNILRNEIWKDPERFLNKSMEVRFQSVNEIAINAKTKRETHDLCFARYLKIREDM